MHLQKKNWTWVICVWWRFHAWKHTQLRQLLPRPGWVHRTMTEELLVFCIFVCLICQDGDCSAVLKQKEHPSSVYNSSNSMLVSAWESCRIDSFVLRSAWAVQGCRGLKPITANTEVKPAPWTGFQFITGISHRYRQPSMVKFTSTANLEQLINLMSMSLGCGRTPTQAEVQHKKSSQKGPRRVQNQNLSVGESVKKA